MFSKGEAKQRRPRFKFPLSQLSESSKGKHSVKKFISIQIQSFSFIQLSLNKKNKKKKKKPYHRKNRHLNIERFVQLRNGEIPIPNGAIKRGSPAVAQNLSARHHYHRRHRRRVTFQRRNLAPKKKKKNGELYCEKKERERGS